jgi:hypothetical protein
VTDESSGSAEPVTDEDGSSGSAGGEAPQPEPKRVRLLLTIAAVVLVLDIVTKVLAVRLLTPGQPVSIVGDTITWTLVRNSGAAFSMATGYTWVLTLVATGVVIGIIWMGRRLVSPWWAVGLGMILGGAMGNLGRSVLPLARGCAGMSWISSPLAGGRCSTWPTRRWWAGRSCWLPCRCSVLTSIPSVAARPTRHSGYPLDAGPRWAGGDAC